MYDTPRVVKNHSLVCLYRSIAVFIIHISEDFYNETQ